MAEVSSRAAAVAALVVLAFTLAGCSDQEVAQRKSFIEFLQTRIIDKPGVHVPALTTELEDKLGVYAKHYAVITTFNADMDQSVSGFLPKAMRVASVTSIADAVARRDAIAAVRGQMSEMRAALAQKLAAAEAARVGLTQPADLKPVYDAAFDRDVRSTALGFEKELPLFEDAMTSILSLPDYLNSHRDKVTVQGSVVGHRSNDPRRGDGALDDITKKTQQLQDSQRRLSKIATGLALLRTSSALLSAPSSAEVGCFDFHDALCRPPLREVRGGAPVDRESCDAVRLAG